MKFIQYIQLLESSEHFSDHGSWQARARAKSGNPDKVFFKKRASVTTAVNKMNYHSLGYWDDDAHKGYIYESVIPLNETKKIKLKDKVITANGIAGVVTAEVIGKPDHYEVTYDKPIKRITGKESKTGTYHKTEIAHRSDLMKAKQNKFNIGDNVKIKGIDNEGKITFIRYAFQHENETNKYKVNGKFWNEDSLIKKDKNETNR